MKVARHEVPAPAQCVDRLAVGYGFRATSTVAQFCADHNISKSFFYELVRKGHGPRLLKLGRRTLISAEAAADWRRQIERTWKHG